MFSVMVFPVSAFVNEAVTDPVTSVITEPSVLSSLHAGHTFALHGVSADDVAAIIERHRPDG
jgi:hypothetical protein